MPATVVLSRPPNQHKERVHTRQQRGARAQNGEEGHVSNVRRSQRKAAIQDLKCSELCVSVRNGSGYCSYGDKCLFAHSIDQLRPREQHVKYKTTFCKNYGLNGYCPFGSRCTYIHDEFRIVKDSEVWLVSPSEGLVRIETGLPPTATAPVPAATETETDTDKEHVLALTPCNSSDTTRPSTPETLTEAPAPVPAPQPNPRRAKRQPPRVEVSTTTVSNTAIAAAFGLQNIETIAPGTSFVQGEGVHLPVAVPAQSVPTETTPAAPDQRVSQQETAAPTPVQPALPKHLNAEVQPFVPQKQPIPPPMYRPHHGVPMHIPPFKMHDGMPPHYFMPPPPHMHMPMPYGMPPHMRPHKQGRYQQRRYYPNPNQRFQARPPHAPPTGMIKPVNQSQDVPETDTDAVSEATEAVEAREPVETVQEAPVQETHKSETVKSEESA